ncbi:MAG TPA: methyltransferase [Desulfobacteraceae bacterium]|nr:methyltransferase [Desulfobacteraceae bacterium]
MTFSDIVFPDKIRPDDPCRCPLCRSDEVDAYHRDDSRAYMACRTCGLVFVPEAFRLTPEEEKAVYDLHQNDPGDPGYQNFLSRLSVPLLKKLSPGSQGLDFGCGPGPALADMMEAAGHSMNLFDPFYANTPEVLQHRYDFICATEVVEHLRAPKREFESLFKMLKPGGWLGIMTKQVINREAFGRWHYIRDLTHICFYSRFTFSCLARRFNAGLYFIGDDVILLQKQKKECQ